MKPRFVVGGLVACAAMSSGGVLAQDETQEIETQEIQNEVVNEVEEIIVTGSFIRRDKFDMASPVETITPEVILESGETSISGLVRSLTFTQNVDTVANVLASSSGQQDSTGAQFNLRGLGSTSTLTLFDGRRAVAPDSISAILPELAMGSVDIVLDGGAATYGTDAVAGVVNFVPLQKYDGFKVRTFYSIDQKGDVPEPKLNMLWGKSWDKVDVVAALDYSKRKHALLRSDRPRYNKAENNTSTTGNPGTYLGYYPGYSIPGIPMSGAAGATIDPACGTFNGDHTDDAYAGVYPSGVPNDTGTSCYWDYGEFNDYKRPMENLVIYTGLTYNLSDKVALKALVNYADWSATLNQSPPQASNSNRFLHIPANHPNNPFGRAVSPSSWRPFAGKMGSTNPSALNSRGVYTPKYSYETYQINLGSEFEIGDTGWYGETWGVYGSRTRNRQAHEINLTRLNLALNGQGGPNGDEWFNPFGSASQWAVPVAGSPNTGFGDCAPTPGAVDPNTGNPCSNNSQALLDWIFTGGNVDDQEKTYRSFEAFVGGDLFDLPAGPLAMAVGVQYRLTKELERPSSQSGTQPAYYADGSPMLSPGGGPIPNDYNSSPLNGLADANRGQSEVYSLFTEFDIPLTERLGMIMAFRYEDFKDFNMSTVVPKVSFRWEALDNLAFRTSWGQGFLAPSIKDALIDPTPAAVRATAPRRIHSASHTKLQ